MRQGNKNIARIASSFASPRRRSFLSLPPWLALLLLACAPAFPGNGLAQDTNGVAALKAQMQEMKAQHAAEIQRLEMRMDDIQRGASNQVHVSREGITTLTAAETAKEEGEIETYHESTALEAYEDTLPANVLATNNFLHNQLFDYLSKGFEWQGYFRAGAGINSKGGHMDAFQAPGAPAKYRLGNEADTYVETVVNEKNWNPNPDGVKINTQIRVAYKTQQSKSEDMDNKVVLREMFAAMSNFIEANPSTKVWAGERFYRLPQLYINDFWWYDMSGYGGGLEDIDIGSGRMHVAYIVYSESASSFWTSTDQGAFDYNTSNGRLAKNNINIMFSDLYAGAGKFTAWVNGGFMQGGTATNRTASYEYPSQAGIDCGLMHQLKGKQAQNQLALQYGYGCNSSLSAAGNAPPTDDNSHANIVRLTEMYDHQITGRFSAEFAGVMQYFNSGAEADADATWASCGVRPIYQFLKHFGIELEPGLDYVNDRKNNIDSHLFKFTTALRITPATEFFSRPEFRLFATYAQWGKDFEGNPAMGGTGFLNRRNGMNFGVQVEHWW
jgi:maltoporin